MKEANQKIVEEYVFRVHHHHRERIGNFKIEPPGLFRGRGVHHKQGMLKKRIQDVITYAKWDWLGSEHWLDGKGEVTGEERVNERDGLLARETLWSSQLMEQSHNGF